MGQPKLLLPWCGSTVIGQIISQWRELGAAQIVIVLRAEDAPLAVELDRLHFPKANRIENPQPERGMFSSIGCAANWAGWQKGIARWAIVLGDQPHLQMETLTRLAEFSTQHAEAVCLPVHNGRVAHPVILPRSSFAGLKATRANTLKEYLMLTADEIIHQRCVLNDSGLTLDMDTPEDYQNLTMSPLSA